VTNPIRCRPVPFKWHRMAPADRRGAGTQAQCRVVRQGLTFVHFSAHGVPVYASHVERRAVVEVGDERLGMGGGNPNTSGVAGRTAGTNCKPEGAGTTWKPADARRGAKCDGLSDRHADSVLRAGSARLRNARGGARLGAQLAVALSLRPRAFCRLGPLELCVATVGWHRYGPRL
jgi:hypothetical protein